MKKKTHHTFQTAVFLFYFFHGQKGFRFTDTNVNNAAVILHTLHTSTQDLQQQQKKKNNYTVVYVTFTGAVKQLNCLLQFSRG